MSADNSLIKFKKKNSKTILDVIFIHGIGGDKTLTWHPEEKSNCYLPQWLSDDFNNISIWTLGYPANITNWNRDRTYMSLPDRARNVLEYLVNMGIGEKPMIFIVHSLGGLLLKQMLRHSKELKNENWLKFSENTKDVIFIATPHQGSSLANIADAFRTIIQPTTILKELQSNSPNLRDLATWYSQNANSMDIKTHAYYEMTNFKGIMVVDPSSADPNVQGCVPIPMDGNHSTICKLENKNTPLYRSIIRIVKECLNKVSSITNDEIKRLPQLRQNFKHLIDSHTYLFAGRNDHIQSILDVIQNHESGYIFIEGLSGYGKTSLLANLVKKNPTFVYHFISQAYKVENSNFDSTTMDFLLLNLCEQLEHQENIMRSDESPKSRFYRFVSEPPIRGPRVIVIDAVDEVDKHPNYLLGLLPFCLPPNVFIIFSARKLGDIDYLSEIGLNPQVLSLHLTMEGLGITAISQLLKQVGGKAFPLSSNLKFIERLFKISEGDPFYLRFLIEDISLGIITLKNICDTPKGLNSYLDLQLSILDRSAKREEQKHILGLILDSEGPLSRKDLIHIIPNLDGFNFDNTIRDIKRFLIVNRDTYTFCHNRFKEYFHNKMA